MPRSYKPEIEVSAPPGELRPAIIEELVKQLEPYLPVKSFEDLSRKTETISIAGLSIPLKMLKSHISPDNFPVRDVEDMRRKITEGARRAVSLGSTRSISRSDIFNRAVGSLTQGEAKIGLRLPPIYRTFYPDIPE